MAHRACGAWRRRSDQVPRTSFIAVPNSSQRRHSQAPIQPRLLQTQGESCTPTLRRQFEVAPLEDSADNIHCGCEDRSDDEYKSKQQRHVQQRKMSVEEKLNRTSVEYIRFESMLDFLCKSNELASSHHRRMLLHKVLLAWHMHTIARMQLEHDFELGCSALRQRLSYREVLYSQDLVTRCIFDHWYWFAIRKTRLVLGVPTPSRPTPPTHSSESPRYKDRQRDDAKADGTIKSGPHQSVQPRHRKGKYNFNERCHAKRPVAEEATISKKKIKRRRRRRRRRRLVSGCHDDTQETVDDPCKSRSEKSEKLRLPE